MESSWRWDVWEEGLTGAGYELVASVFGSHTDFVAKLDVPNPRIYRILRKPLGLGQIPVPIQTKFIPLAHPHFPYGEDVDPDNHM